MPLFRVACFSKKRNIFHYFVNFESRKEIEQYYIKKDFSDGRRGKIYLHGNLNKFDAKKAFLIHSRSRPH